MGIHLALIAHTFDLEIEDELAEIVPPDPNSDDGEIDWLPGDWQAS
jgi:hypothetical protein